jgi:hypothetical protein
MAIPTIEASPVAHGRTAYLDFRPMLLAHPADWIGEGEVLWAQRHILAATRFAETLRQGERWICVRRPGLTVFGVAAMAARLSDTRTHEITRDGGTERPRRPLFAFVGFATRDPLGQPDAVLPRDLALYRGVYEELFGPRWLEERIGTAWERATPTSPRPIALEPAGADPAVAQPAPAQIGIYPTAFGDAVWRLACAGPPPVAVALNMPAILHARGSPFDICTVPDAAAPTKLDRPASADAPPGRPVVPPDAQPPHSAARADSLFRAPGDADFPSAAPEHKKKVRPGRREALLVGLAAGAVAIGFAAWRIVTSSRR